MGYVYLIHFENKYYHAQHYIGWAKVLKNRIADHRASRGSRLIQVINENGIAWEMVYHKKGTRQDERKLKNKKKARLFCPKCLQEHER